MSIPNGQRWYFYLTEVDVYSEMYLDLSLLTDLRASEMEINRSIDPLLSLSSFFPLRLGSHVAQASLELDM